MRKPDDLIPDPPAIVQPAESIDLDILMAEAKLFGRQTQESAVACGQALARAKAACPRGKFDALLQKHGFSRRTGYRLIALAKDPNRANLARLVGEESMTEEPADAPPALTVQLNTIYCRPCRVSGRPKAGCKACKEARDKKLSLFATVEPQAPPAEPVALPGDSAEVVPPDLLVDAEGAPLPESARIALADDSVDRWCAHVEKSFHGLDGLVTRPSGRFVNAKVLKKKLSAVARMAKAQKPTPGRVYACPQCPGPGCERCRGEGWIPHTIWSGLS